MVHGDTFPQIVSKYYDILAVPLTEIFNLVKATHYWPKLWKKETTTIIPKNEYATTFNECRNLACTPLFSKVLESYLLDAIRKETKIDPRQYGGHKKCGTDHLLIVAWDRILFGLEDNRGSVGMISLDLAKAFNRMSHQACLQAFAKKGASSNTLGWIAAFLTRRTMSVKIGNHLSKERDIQGGSPQGCVTANTLFCTTIEFLQEGEFEAGVASLDFNLEEDNKEQSSLFEADLILNNISPAATLEEERPGIPFVDNGREDLSDTMPDQLPPFRPTAASSPVITECSLEETSE